MPIFFVFSQNTQLRDFLAPFWKFLMVLSKLQGTGMYNTSIFLDPRSGESQGYGDGEYSAGGEANILTSSLSVMNCLGSCWRQLMQPAFDVNTDHSSSLITAW